MNARHPCAGGCGQLTTAAMCHPCAAIEIRRRDRPEPVPKRAADGTGWVVKMHGAMQICPPAPLHLAQCAEVR
jgi:hypothetical protein